MHNKQSVVSWFISLFSSINYGEIYNHNDLPWIKLTTIQTVFLCSPVLWLVSVCVCVRFMHCINYFYSLELKMVGRAYKMSLATIFGKCYIYRCVVVWWAMGANTARDIYVYWRLEQWTGQTCPYLILIHLCRMVDDKIRKINNLFRFSCNLL